jgi:hypothetical protein
MGDDSIYDSSLIEWQTTVEEFLNEPDWPKGWDAPGVPAFTRGDDVSHADQLRAFWNQRGCVRCWWETHATLFTGDKVPIIKYDPQRVYLANTSLTGWLQTRIQNWRNPATRKKPRSGQPPIFFCQRHAEKLDCVAGIAFAIQSWDVGHMAWGYEYPMPWIMNFSLSAAPWRMGENAVTLGDQAPAEEDWQSPDICWNKNLNEYKLLTVEEGNFEEAYLRAMWIFENGFNLVTRNCQASAQYVLEGYGADLPMYVPAEPEYYANIQGEVHKLEPPDQPVAPPPAPRRAPAKRKSPSRTATPLRALQALVQTTRAAKSIHAENLQRALDTAAAALPAPPAARSRSRKRQPEAPMVDTIYLLETSRTIHLAFRCPALNSRVTAPRREVVPITDDMDELAKDQQGPVCATCVRMLASSKVVYNISNEFDSFDVMTDRLVNITGHGTRQEKRLEIGLEDLATCEPGFFGEKVVIGYNNFVGSGRFVSHKLKLSFDSREERDACLSKIDSVWEKYR